MRLFRGIILLRIKLNAQKISETMGNKLRFLPEAQLPPRSLYWANDLTPSVAQKCIALCIASQSHVCWFLLVYQSLEYQYSLMVGLWICLYIAFLIGVTNFLAPCHMDHGSCLIASLGASELSLAFSQCTSAKESISTLRVGHQSNGLAK